MTRIQIDYQDGTATDLTVDNVNWCHITASLGVHLLPNGDLAFDNGVGNAGTAGTVYWHSIKIDGVLICEPGLHCFPPRSILPIRRSGLRHATLHTDHLPASRVPWIQAGTVKARDIQDAIAQGVVRQDLDFYFPRMGPWFPMTKAGPQPGGTGGSGLDFLPGWERVSALTLQRADAVSQGMAVAYVDASTGLPLPHHTQPRYEITRGWGKVTQLQEFCAPATLDPYDDRRIPRKANAGTCDYEYTLAGVDRYSGCCARDGQHLIRGYSDALAGWHVWRDPLCKLYLDLVAGDAALRWNRYGLGPTRLEAGAGWWDFGREAGWVLNLMRSIGHPEAMYVDRAFRWVRMPGSVHQRAPVDGNQGAPAPGGRIDPATGQLVQVYADSGQYVAQSIEAAICGYACSEVVEVALAMTLDGNPSHFMLVEPGQPPKLDKRASVERESYNVWALVGRALQYATPEQRVTLLDRTTRMNLPNDPNRYTTPEALLQAAVANGEMSVMAPLIRGLEA